MLPDAARELEWSRGAPQQSVRQLDRSGRRSTKLVESVRQDDEMRLRFDAPVRLNLDHLVDEPRDLGRDFLDRLVFGHLGR